MKTKIVIGSLLAVIMLVIVPVLTVTESETTAGNIAAEVTTPEETTVEETTSEDTTPEETTVEETTPEETTAKHTECFPFGFVKASFSGVPDRDVDSRHGLILTYNIFVNSTGGTLTTPLKINGKTIVESRTPVTLKISVMAPLGYKQSNAGLAYLNVKRDVDLSGFALGITVTY
ncbi:MAG: hypothetical protein KAJ44_02560 [Thermoplasmatales archaeon]|nr:hypothetical protein [Thermoplasmatales archaeon]